VSDKKYALTLGYNSDGNADKLAEVQASALQVSSFDLADVATNHDPQQYQVLAWSAVGDGTFLYAPSTITAGGGGGGGGGVSFPTGSIGDVLYYHANGTSVTSIDPTTTPLNLATTGYVQSELADYAPLASPTLVTPNLGTPSVLNGTNITSLGAGAGALLDSEVANLAEVKAFDSTDYATAAQGAKADSAQQPPTEGAFANGDKTKLDGITAGATPTNTTNVTNAGALMDSEVVHLAFVKSLASGISDGNVLTANNDVNPGDFLRINGTEVEGRTASEVRGDLEVPHLGSTNTFTQANAFQNGLNVTGPVVFTGVASFTQTPTVNGTNVTVDTDLATYVTEAEFDGSAGNFFVTSTGSNGNLILKGSTNTTTTVTPGTFISNNSIVTSPDPNTFTNLNTFQAGLNVTSVGLNVTGPASFNTTPQVNGNDVAVGDLANYATAANLAITNANLAATGAQLATTNAFGIGLGVLIQDIAAGGASTVYVLSADAKDNQIY